jgi:hypothetical protein
MPKVLSPDLTISPLSLKPEKALNKQQHITEITIDVFIMYIFSGTI